MKNYALVLCVIIILSLLCGFGNALMIYQNDTQLILSSDQIVYGKIVDMKSAWNAQKTHIETTAQIQVAVVFINSKNAGITSGSTIPVTILGGVVGNSYEVVEDEPAFLLNTDAFVYLKKSADGKFTVNGHVNGVHPVFTNKTTISGKKVPQSTPDVERFKEQINKTLQGIPTDLNPPGLPASLFAQSAPSGQLGISAPTIYSVTPSSASAGTDTVITITGSGFGAKASRASLANVIFFSKQINSTNIEYIAATGFPYYDYVVGNGITMNGDCIISWTDTQIQVKVPSGLTQNLYSRSASSGFLRVVTDAGGVYDIPFSVTFGVPKVYGSAMPKPFSWASGAAPYYVNPGSYSGALTAIQNAAATWNNAGSSFRFNYAGVSTSTVSGNDGVNLVFFGPLQDQIGVTSCFGTFSEGLSDCDTKLNSNIQWTTGTASGTTYNIEALTAHELGHWLQLLDLYGDLPDVWGYVGYPSDTNKRMFGFADDIFGNMNLKTLSSGDVAGIKWMYPPSIILPPDYPQKIGLTNGQQWYLDYNGNGVWDGPVTDRVSSFGAVGWTPVTGDWDGNQNIEIGVSNGQAWYLDYNGNGVWDGASTDRVYNFGAYGWKPVVGDWNNDGHTNIGVTNGQQWYLDYNGDGLYTAGTDKQYNFGAYGWTPVIGKWS